MIAENKVTEIFGMEDKFCKFFDITTAKCKLKLLLRENISVMPDVKGRSDAHNNTFP